MALEMTVPLLSTLNQSLSNDFEGRFTAMLMSNPIPVTIVSWSPCNGNLIAHKIDFFLNPWYKHGL